MLIEVPMVVRAHGSHHALVTSANNVTVSFIAIESGGLRIQRLSLARFEREYAPFKKYSPKEMAIRLIEFGQLHGVTGAARAWLNSYVNGEPIMADKNAGETQSTDDNKGVDNEAKAQRTRKSSTVYRFNRDPIEGEKISPQAEVILSTIKGAGADGITRGELIEQLSELLTTKQPVARVLAFYQPKMVESCLITVG